MLVTKFANVIDLTVKLKQVLYKKVALKFFNFVLKKKNFKKRESKLRKKAFRQFSFCQV